VKGETLNCRQCRMPFKQRNATGPEPLFCSNACRQAAHRAKQRVDSPEVRLLREVLAGGQRLSPDLVLRIRERLDG
jgi:hypothetical protein